MKPLLVALTYAGGVEVFYETIRDALVEIDLDWAKIEAAVTAVPELMDGLLGSDSDARDRVASALGEIGDPRAVEPLIVALRDSHWYSHSLPVVRGAEEDRG